LEGKLDETSRSHGCCFSAFGRSFGRSYRAASGAQNDYVETCCNKDSSVGVSSKHDDDCIVFERGNISDSSDIDDGSIERSSPCNRDSRCERSARKFRGNGRRNVRGALA
jgi:hypothetical protein